MTPRTGLDLACVATRRVFGCKQPAHRRAADRMRAKSLTGRTRWQRRAKRFCTPYGFSKTAMLRRMGSGLRAARGPGMTPIFSALISRSEPAFLFDEARDVGDALAGFE